MDNKIFRQKSMDKISSPESLDEYIKVANPAVWMIMIAIILMLCGVCFWGIFGSLESSISMPVISDGNETTCYIIEDYIYKANQSHQIKIDGDVYELAEVSTTPVRLSANNDEQAYVLHLFSDGYTELWVYEAKLKTTLPAGNYTGWIISGTISPIKYVLN